MKSISDSLKRPGSVWLCLLLTAVPSMMAQAGAAVNLQIRADQITARMPPTFHGLMTEENKYAFEGGLYAELIRNRNFKESVPARQNRQKTITLSAEDFSDTNSITDPHKVEPVTADVTGLGSEFTRTVPANSITVLELNGK